MYRGGGIPHLAGRYVFGDFSSHISDDFTEFDHGRLFHLDVDGHHDEDPDQHEDVNDIAEFRLADQDDIGIVLLGMGQDACGELYALGNATGLPFGATGVVLKIVDGEDHDEPGECMQEKGPR